VIQEGTLRKRERY
jgi:cAMP-dependent protein kinase regulator